MDDVKRVAISRRGRDQRDLAETLFDKNIDRMKGVDLDLAMALLIGKTARLVDGGGVEVSNGEDWVPFSPMTCGDDFVEVLAGAELSVHSHPIYGDGLDEDSQSPVDGYYYSCHSMFSGTSTEDDNLRTTVGRTCAKRLAHDLEYDSQWRLDKPGSAAKP